MVRRYIAVVILNTMSLIALFGQRYNGVVDKSIAVVGNEMITISQIESEVQMMQFNGHISDRNLRCEVLENLLVSKLFYTQAKLDSLNVNPDMVASNLNDRMNSILTQLGGEEEVEKYFGKSLTKLRQEWTEALNEQSLVQSMQQEVIGKVPGTTPSQVKEFYRKVPKDSLPIVPAQYQYRQINMYPNKERAEIAVKERLIEYRERIQNGEKFSILASLYSEDPGSAMRGGELGMAARSIFWPAFSDAAMSLKPGQISPIVETPDGFHIIQMIEKKGDMFNARHILLKPKYTSLDRDSVFNRLDSLRTAILADSISFSLAAKVYSQDAASRTNGGIVADPYSGAAFFEMDQLKPQDYAAIKDLKEGELSAPFESVDNEGRNGNTVYKIVKLERIIPAHTASYEQDFNMLQEMTKSSAHRDAIEQFIKEKQAVTYIVIDPLFQGCDFMRDGWIK